MHDPRCAWPWFHTAEPLGECRFENWSTSTSNIMIKFAGKVLTPKACFKTLLSKHSFYNLISSTYMYLSSAIVVGSIQHVQMGQM